MSPDARNKLIVAGTQKLQICLLWIADCDDCVLATNSGGIARYIVGTLDDGNLFIEKLDWRSCPI